MIAFWYRVDPATMDGRTKAGLIANLESMKAQHTIHLGQFDPADYETVFRLYLLAYGDAELAHKARSHAMEIYVDRKVRHAKYMDE